MMKGLSDMETVCVNGKNHTGTLMKRAVLQHAELAIYQTNAVMDKYLVILFQNEQAESFIVSGFNRVYEIIHLVDQKKDAKQLWNDLLVEIRNSRKPKVDMRSILTELYDRRYAEFVYLGMKYPKLIKVAKELAL